jgi:hypothetical protein
MAGLELTSRGGVGPGLCRAHGCLRDFPNKGVGLGYVCVEGSKKRSGGECESIKIPRWNLTYIPKSTRRGSLLTPSRPHSYQEDITLGIGLGAAVKIRIDASKNTCEIDDKNQIKTRFMSLKVFH